MRIFKCTNPVFRHGCVEDLDRGVTPEDFQEDRTQNTVPNAMDKRHFQEVVGNRTLKAPDEIAFLVFKDL